MGLGKKERTNGESGEADSIVLTQFSINFRIYIYCTFSNIVVVVVSSVLHQLMGVFTLGEEGSVALQMLNFLSVYLHLCGLPLLLLDGTML